MCLRVFVHIYLCKYTHEEHTHIYIYTHIVHIYFSNFFVYVFSSQFYSSTYQLTCINGLFENTQAEVRSGQAESYQSQNALKTVSNINKLRRIVND